jgi:phosphoglycolate phosphatase-like HAD superfamily hydrolase
MRLPRPCQAEPVPDDRPLAVFDLDGVLADVRGRLHHLQSRPKNWAAFFAAIPDDPPLVEGVALARSLAGQAEVVYLTGRPETTRADTEGWLARHSLPPGRLVMRGADDRRPARSVKPRLLRRVAGHRRVLVVVDDDPLVCESLAADGWPVQVADWMDRAPTLSVAQEQEGRT